MGYYHHQPVCKFVFFRHGQFMEMRTCTFSEAKRYAQKSGMKFRKDDENTLSNEAFKARAENAMKFGNGFEYGGRFR